MRILIVQPSSLGDVVHAMPAVQDLRSWYPQAEIDWIVEPRYAPLVERVEGLGEVLKVPLRRWRQAWWTATVRRDAATLRERLADVAYDAVIDLHGLTASAWIARWAKLTPQGHRYGVGNGGGGVPWDRAARWLVDRPIRVEPEAHALDRARRIVARAFGRHVTGLPRYGLRARAVEAGRGDDRGPQVVLVHGSTREEKQWPQPNWVTLGRRLLAQGWRLALPQADEAEQTQAELIAAALQFERAPQVEVWPTLTLDQVVDRLAAAQAVIGVDSGLSHIAVALGLPHVRLYNLPNAWRTGPQAAHGRANQVCVQGSDNGRAVPNVDAVWAAWDAVRPRHSAHPAG